MSRSGYSDDCENVGLWQAAVDRAIAGKRGQKFLREMVTALDAMPVKELITGELVRDDAHVCAIGAVAVARKLDVSDLDGTDGAKVGDRFGIARAMACEIVYQNDEWQPLPVRAPDGGWSWPVETPAERWSRMRAWVARTLGESQDR
jgi:hypothetical protein